MAGEPTASSAQSAPSGCERGQQLAQVARIAIVRGSHRSCEGTARGQRVDGHDRARTPQAGALHAELADAAGADHDHDVSGGDLARRADPGQRRAAEQRGLGRGHLVGQLEHAARGHHDALGERAHGGHAVDRLAVCRQAGRAVGERPRADARAQRQAGRRAPGQTRAALAAGGRPGEDHAIADGQAVHLRADRLDDAGALVSEHHRPRANPFALDDVQVGAADADRVDAYQRIERAGALQVDLAHDERGARRLEERRAHPHRRERALRQSAAAISADGAISHSHVSA